MTACHSSLPCSARPPSPLLKGGVLRLWKQFLLHNCPSFLLLHVQSVPPDSQAYSSIMRRHRLPLRYRVRVP